MASLLFFQQDLQFFMFMSQLKYYLFLTSMDNRYMYMYTGYTYCDAWF